MNSENKTQAIMSCITCGFVAIKTSADGNCLYCQKELKEIGWVEE